MKPPARAAAVRGDDYQYAVAWWYACTALTEPGIASISVEDPAAGSFDDVAVRRHDNAPDQFFQVKSSNAGDVAITDHWLTTPATKTGRSPLQHFHRTWQTLAAADRPFQLTLLTNRGFDTAHPLLGAMRDLLDCRIRVDELQAVRATTAAGRTRTAWAVHLGVEEAELVSFLAAVRWEQSGPESTWRANAKPLMKVAGLRDDDAAVEIGLGIIRDLVKTGRGGQTPDELRRIVDQRRLLATATQLILAVHGIDRPAAPDVANVTVDWVDRFIGDEPRRRHRTADPADWTVRFPDSLTRARTSLESYEARRVLITGAMRLPAYFAVGHLLPDVRGWVLAVNQRGVSWTTDAPPEPGVAATVRTERVLGEEGADLAVAIALANDLTEDVCAYINEQQLPVRTLLTLGPDGDPGATAVPSNEWLTAWVRSARDVVRRASRDADRIHLFMSAPASAALLLGHQWNTLRPTTTVYEFDWQDYFPTFQLG
ncbi:SAVED domain-containing protein [Blastococcus sp. SYSU D00669]